MDYEFISVDRGGPIATLTLSRPERSNALTIKYLGEIKTAAETFRDDIETRVLIVRAEGKHFSVGIDLQDPPMPMHSDDGLLAKRRIVTLGGDVIAALRAIPQVTICAVHGVATGGGACITTACDFRIASDDARIGYAEVQRGMNLMWRALPLCVRLVGPARAKRMIMLGDLVDAKTLFDWGYVDDLVPRADLETTAMALAERYAALPPNAVQMIKKSIDAVASALDDAIMHMDSDQYLLAASSDDRVEGIEAFLEKREPKFTGR